MWLNMRLVERRPVARPEKPDARNAISTLLYGSVEDMAKLYDRFPVMAVMYGYGAMTEEQKMDAAIRCPETLLETLIHRLNQRQRSMAIVSAPIFAALQVFPYLTKDEINLIFDIIYDQALYQVPNISMICASLLVARAVKKRNKFEVNKVTDIARENLMEFVKSRDLTDISGLPAYLADMRHLSSSKQHYTVRTKFKFIRDVIGSVNVFGPISLLYLWEHYIPRGHIVSEHSYALPRLFNPFVFNAYLNDVCDKIDKYRLAGIALDVPFAITTETAIKIGRSIMQTDIYPIFRSYMQYLLSNEDMNKLDSLFVVSSVDKVFSGD